MRGGNGVFVAVEMQIDLFRRQNLRSPAASGTAFDAEHRAELQFAQCGDCLLPESFEALDDADGGYCFSFVGAGRRNAGDQYELAFGRSAGCRQTGEADFGRVSAEGFKIGLGNADLARSR